MRNADVLVGRDRRPELTSIAESIPTIHTITAISDDIEITRECTSETSAREWAEEFLLRGIAKEEKSMWADILAVGEEFSEEDEGKTECPIGDSDSCYPDSDYSEELNFEEGMQHRMTSFVATTGDRQLQDKYPPIPPDEIPEMKMLRRLPSRRTQEKGEQAMSQPWRKRRDGADMSPVVWRDLETTEGGQLVTGWNAEQEDVVLAALDESQELMEGTEQEVIEEVPLESDNQGRRESQWTPRKEGYYSPREGCERIKKDIHQLMKETYVIPQRREEEEVFVVEVPRGGIPPIRDILRSEALNRRQRSTYPWSRQEEGRKDGATVWKTETPDREDARWKRNLLDGTGKAEKQDSATLGRQRSTYPSLSEQGESGTAKQIEAGQKENSSGIMLDSGQGELLLSDEAAQNQQRRTCVAPVSDGKEQGARETGDLVLEKEERGKLPSAEVGKEDRDQGDTWKGGEPVGPSDDRGEAVFRDGWPAYTYGGELITRVRAPRVGDSTLRAAEEFGKKCLGFPVQRRPREFRKMLDRETDMESVEQWIREQHEEFIGADGWKEMSAKEKEMSQRVLYTWREIFYEKVSGVPATDLVTHTIPTYPDAAPTAAKLPQYTPAEKKWQDEQLPKMMRNGILTHCISPWSAGTRLVAKKGPGFRIVHNYKPLNAATIKTGYPIGRIDSAIQAVGQRKFKIFFQADAANGYWAVPLELRDAYKTAFPTSMGQLCYLRMGQGLTGAPRT